MLKTHMMKLFIFWLWGMLVCAPLLYAQSTTTGEDSQFIDPEYSKKISMDFKDASLTDVLKIFSQQSGTNFIAAQDVSSKKITLFFENIPVEEALTKILDANNLTYETQSGSGIFIVKEIPKVQKKVITRVYPLKYATVPSSKLNKTISISTSTSDSSSSSSSGSSSSSEGSGSGTASSTGSTDTASTSTSEGIYAAVKALLTSSGVLIEDPRTNSLIVTDEESRFLFIEEVLAKLDVPVPEILIEVEMLDVSKDASDLLGIKFTDTPLVLKGTQNSTLLPLTNDNNIDGLVSKGFLKQPTYTPGNIDASGGTGGYFAKLQFLKTRTDTKNLARPRLLTLNNQTAQIKISTNEAIGIATSTNTTSSTGTQTVEAERVQTGVFLTVTPQANLLTREITMAVYPKVIQARVGATFQNTQFKDPEERGAQSILTINDGETIIIGGLLRTDDSNTVTKVPFLGDIPLIGMPFRHKNKTGNNRELIIFITPHIMDEKMKAKLLHKQDDVPESVKQSNKPARSVEVNRALSTLEQQRF